MFSGLKGQHYMALALLMADQWSTRQQAKLQTLFSISAHVAAWSTDSSSKGTATVARKLNVFQYKPMGFVVVYYRIL